MDGTETPGGPSSAAGQASEGGAQGTSTSEPRTYTEQEHKDALQKAVSDALATAGRDAKALSQQKADLQAERDAITAERAEVEEAKRQRDAEELAAARTDPAKLSAYQAKKAREAREADIKAREDAIKKREQEQARKEAEHAEKVRAAEEVTLGMKLYEIAAKHDVNPEDLKTGIKELGLTTEAQAETLAKRLAKRPAGSEGEATHPVHVPPSGGARKPSSLTADEKLQRGFAELNKKK